jgi:phosphohistidine swiveling domain-containing protein
VVIADAKEIGVVKEGDVLVTKMTNPDMVPAMRKVKAIVTDEGGMTCHAAIVSRELGTPAVVGSRTATQVLKTGQMVTVDGQKGVVYEGEVAPAPTPKAVAEVASQAAAAPLILHVAVPVPAIGLQVIWAALLILSFPALLLLLGFATREETAVTKSALRGLARFVSRDSRQPVTS